MVRDLKAPADFASVLICKLGQKLVLAMEGRINKQMPASFNVVSYSSENVEMVYRHQSPPVPSSRKPSHAISGKLCLTQGCGGAKALPTSPTTEAGARFALEPVLRALQLPPWNWIVALEESAHVCWHVWNGCSKTLSFLLGARAA